MDVFNTCQEINNLLNYNEEDIARDELIKLLDYHKTENLEYSALVNHLIRQTGLYPYIDEATARWEDGFVYEAFKADVGLENKVTLHREQSSLLKKLLNGESIAVSAPTSFGKSFIIDAFISIQKPQNVVIIVPTIALTDETRRRLYSKFSDKYKIITTSDVELGEKNILIFPQERANSYLNKIESIDILIIDEFYKASPNFDKERSPALLKAILELGKKTIQKYFLAPNISELKKNFFTMDVEFLELKFNTVFLKKYDLYEEIGGDEDLKSKKLLEITDQKTKALIYAGTYTSIDKIGGLLRKDHNRLNNDILESFASWLSDNYSPNWTLPSLIKRGIGVHNGSLHRSLSQLQVWLFEKSDGIVNMISTSSIIEGVNTSAENVIIWLNKNGNYNLNNFTYKNIIGRGGRMFKHFVGNIFVLEEPPQEEDTQLELSFTDKLLGEIDEVEYEQQLTKDQLTKIDRYKSEMHELMGEKNYKRIKDENVFQMTDSELHMEIAKSMKYSSYEWNGLNSLNSDNVEIWDNTLYNLLRLKPGSWETAYSKFVEFVKISSQNWNKLIPELLKELEYKDVGIDLYFKLERVASFRLASLIHDVNVLNKIILENNVDLSPFVSRLSHAFLPSVVYQLEEYGLPRMISKKIHEDGLIDFEDPELDIHTAIENFQFYKKDNIKAIESMGEFDKHIIDFFYEGIELGKINPNS